MMKNFYRIYLIIRSNLQSDKSKADEGFTLLEIILAISILATIGIFTINILSQQLTMKKKVTEIDSARHVLDRVMNRIYSDIKMAYIAKSSNNSSLTSPVGASINTSLSLNNQVRPQFYLKREQLVFTTKSFVSYLRNSNQSNLMNVKYFVQTDPKRADFKQLVRVYDTDLVDSLDRKDVGKSQVLIDDIAEFKINFWNGNDFTMTEWDSENGTTAGLLPKLVKIHLVMYMPSSTEIPGPRDPTDKTKAMSLDTIVLLNSAIELKELNPSTWEKYPWQ